MKITLRKISKCGLWTVRCDGNRVDVTVESALAPDKGYDVHWTVLIGGGRCSNNVRTLKDAREFIASEVLA